MINLKALTKKVARGTALRNISLSVDSENLAVLGDSDSGMDTLVKLLCGSISPDSGSATLDGDALTSRGAAERIGYMPKNCALSPSVSLADAMEFAAKLRGLDLSAVNGALEEAEMMDNAADLPVGVLTAFEQKKASLAFALLGSPDYIIADRPISGLGEEEEAEMLELLQALSEDYTFIYFSDTVDDARAVCDRVMLLAGGKNIVCDSFDTVISPNYEIAEYKARTRGDADALRAALSASEAIKKYQVSVTASGTAIIELSLHSGENAERILRGIFADAGQKVIELKQADSPIEKVLSKLYENQEAKEAERRERRAEKAAPVKVTSDLVARSFAEANAADTADPEDVDEDVLERSEDREDAVNPTEKGKKTAFDDAIFKMLSDRDSESETENSDEDSDSTLF